MGDEGYYYMSYYDVALIKSSYSLDMVMSNVEEVNNYKSNYQYNPLGFIGSLGFDNDTGYFANQFTSNEDEALAAFSLYTMAVNSEYETKIYVNGELKGIQSGTITNPGYHTIKLNNKINLAKDDLFRIEVKLTSLGCLNPIALEAPIVNTTSKATSEANQSFVSKDGINWIDLSNNNDVVYFWTDDSIGHYLTLNNTNVCLKAFTVSLKETSICADNLTIKAKDNETLDILLSSEENSQLANQVITVEINDLKINLTTDENGIAHLPLNNIPAGVYEVNFTFAGANGYSKSKNSSILTVIPLNTIIEANVTDLGNNNYLISGIIKDEKGNPVNEGNLDIIVSKAILTISPTLKCKRR
ncbi:MAG: lectin like domain-containing protein [archaeon]|nr:lectin like domain-containing protein [archaeon]